MHIENQKIKQIKELCKQHKVKTLFAFGSVTRDDFKADSDIDLVVDFDEKDSFIYTEQIQIQVENEQDPNLKVDRFYIVHYTSIGTYIFVF